MPLRADDNQHEQSSVLYRKQFAAVPYDTAKTHEQLLLEERRCRPASWHAIPEEDSV
jgi:hypothetical protein